MFFRKVFILIIFFFITNCTTVKVINSKSKIKVTNNFSNKGFALIYHNKLYDDGLVSKKIDERSLIIFQKNLKINTQVKIKNILNNKSLVANVGKKSDYPIFNNSVISKRIAEELNLDFNEPYIEITEIDKDSIFLAKKAKTFDEEKTVAIKAPVNGILISDLNQNKASNIKKPNKKFAYEIKIADFYFNNTPLMMKDRIIHETSVKNPKIRKITKEKYRVYLGPFDNINSLQKTYNDINILGFENIEIIKND